MASGDVLAVLHPWGGDPPTSNPMIIDTRNNRRILKASGTTAQRMIWTFPPPTKYAGGSLRLEAFCSMSADIAGKVAISAAIERNEVGVTNISTDSFAAAVLSSSTTVPTTAGLEFKVSVTLTSTEIDGLTAADPYRVAIARDVSIADNATGFLEYFLLQLVEA